METIDFTDPGGAWSPCIPSPLYICLSKLCLLKLNFLLSANPFNLKQTIKGNKDNSMRSVNEIQT